MNLSGVSFPYLLFGLDQGLEDVRRILRVAPQRKEDDSQPRKSAEALYRAAVVLGCAAWEAFLEDLALEAIRRVVARYKAGQTLSPSAHEVAARNARLGDLASVRWHDPFSLQACRDTFLGIFNTPKAAATDRLFERVMDLDRLSDSWLWKGAPRSVVKQRLDAFVTLRGDIAHRKKSLRRLCKADVLEHVRLIDRLAVLSCNRVRNWLNDADPEAARHWDIIPFPAVT